MSDFELGRKAGRLETEQTLFPLIDSLNEAGRKLSELLVAAKETTERVRIERDTIARQGERDRVRAELVGCELIDKTAECDMAKKQIKLLRDAIINLLKCRPFQPNGYMLHTEEFDVVVNNARKVF